jgi:hypothetical protein
MQFRSQGISIVAALALVLAPLSALAQDHHDHGNDHGNNHGNNTHQGNHTTTHTTHTSHTTTVHTTTIHSGGHSTGNGHSGDMHFRNGGGRMHGGPADRVIVPPGNWRSQRWDDGNHRDHMRSEWRTLAIGAGLVGAIGLLTNDKYLFFAGAAGALYSVARLDSDRRGDDRHRARAFYFNRPDFWRDGHHFVRQTVWQGGVEYYQFIRI